MVLHVKARRLTEKLDDKFWVIFICVWPKVGPTINLCLEGSRRSKNPLMCFCSGISINRPIIHHSSHFVLWHIALTFLTCGSIMSAFRRRRWWQKHPRGHESQISLWPWSIEIHQKSARGWPWKWNSNSHLTMVPKSIHLVGWLVTQGPVNLYRDEI